MSLPERLGRLRRIERIGAGGFATVWLYRDDDLNSLVAVKALADNWAQRDDIRDRFLEEARILRRADSDHVVRVYDIGENDGTPYFVMSYADLGSMAALLEPGKPLPAATVADLIGQAGLGLDVLHRHGVIHRDIKPQNLLLRSTTDGGRRVLVADLGVAKEMLHASGLTQVVGTPAYMAPEQATGFGVDRRADVHALGAVAYQMITGRLVRHGFESVTSPTRPVPPSTYVPVPAAVDGVLLRALDPDPGQRWPEVLDFTGALRDALLPPTRVSQWTSALEETRVAARPVTIQESPDRRAASPGPQASVPSRPQDVAEDWIRIQQPSLVPAPAKRRRSALPWILIALAVLVITFGAAYLIATWALK